MRLQRKVERDMKGGGGDTSSASGTRCVPDTGHGDGVVFVSAAILAAASVWAYWPTLAGLVGAWNREPDYSHGFFVAPVAIWFLWARRDRFPGMGGGALDVGLGLGLIAASVAVAIYAHFYLDAIDGWLILPWVGGVVLLLAGRKVFWWSLPSIAFLWFMVPLPFRQSVG